MQLRDLQGPPPSYAASWEWFYALHFQLSWEASAAFMYIGWVTRRGHRGVYYGEC